MGGFARRMRFFNAFAEKYPNRATMRLDGGSLFNVGSAEGEVVNRWMLEGAYRSKLDAINLSASDVPAWQELADQASAGRVPGEMLNVPLVSANVSVRMARFPKILPYVIKEYPHNLQKSAMIRVAVTGLLSDPEGRISRSSFQIEDVATAARRFVDRTQGKVHYRIVLTDMDLGNASSLAINVPGIDLILVAHNYSAISDPQQIGQTLIVIPVNEGRMISEVRMTMKPGTAGAEIETRFVPLDLTVPSDPEMKALEIKAQKAVEEFKKSR
jgi:2',3'-cyclic-nucleotide 2'-phosphodiesterase (5'-nucleotidase family)